MFIAYIDLESANLGPNKIVSIITRFYCPKIIVSMHSISFFVEARITSNSSVLISYSQEYLIMQLRAKDVCKTAIKL